MALTLKVLLENRRAAGADPLLQAKAGLSLLIEDETTSILFDTGPDDSFLRNAALMGVDLSRITATVLSHGHYDHCGGVAWLPDNSRIICHPQVGDERYAALKVLGHTRKIKKLSLISTTRATACTTAANRWRSAIALCGQAKSRYPPRAPTG